MVFEVEYDPAARDALRDIADYLSEKSADGARNVLGDIKQSIDLLAEWPRLGREMESVPFRRLVSKKYRYRVFYSLGDDTVTIAMIYHPRQDAPGT